MQWNTEGYVGPHLIFTWNNAKTLLLAWSLKCHYFGEPLANLVQNSLGMWHYLLYHIGNRGNAYSCCVLCPHILLWCLREWRRKMANSPCAKIGFQIPAFNRVRTRTTVNQRVIKLLFEAGGGKIRHVSLIYSICISIRLNRVSLKFISCHDCSFLCSVFFFSLPHVWLFEGTDGKMIFFLKFLQLLLVNFVKCSFVFVRNFLFIGKQRRGELTSRNISDCLDFAF